MEGLEERQLLSKPAPIMKFSQPAFFFNDIKADASGGSGMSAPQALIIRNAGTLPLIFNSKGLVFTGDNADEFVFTGKSVPATIEPGATRTIHIAFKAKAEGIRTAFLRAKSNDTRHRSVSIPLRGLGTKGEGGSLEPSLDRVLQLYQIPDHTGQSDPTNNDFKVPPPGASDDVELQQMVKAGPGAVTIDMLGLFVNDKSPAWAMGYYHPGQPELGLKQLLSVQNHLDAQSVHPKMTGTRSFDPGSKAFGIYTEYPAFTYRHAFSEDALNTWETNSQKRRKIRFYPLKNPDGNVVPNAYVFAAEDYNVVYDYQDGVGIIRNVKLAPATPTIGLQNTDGLPSNDRMVFNRITNPDPIRPNVTHDHGTLHIINSGRADLVINSIALSDNTNFKITSGGGAGTVAAGKTRDVNIQFVANPSSGIISTYNASLTITSNDPDEPTRVVSLGALWQAYSEQTPDHKYDEPSLRQIINTIFGYPTVIVNDGEKTNHQGHNNPVGEEVLSAYWQLADSNIGVNVRMLSSFHRQNNFDPITGEPLTAASSVRWYYKQSKPPSSTTSIFTQNIDEGQCLLPHKTKSTTQNAEGSFKPDPGKMFGFKVDARFSDDSYNPKDFNQAGEDIDNTGHAMRFFPLKDLKGNPVKNTWILAMDYTSNIFANYDYNDNVYIVSNIKPGTPGSSSSGFPQPPSNQPPPPPPTTMSTTPTTVASFSSVNVLDDVSDSVL